MFFKENTRTSQIEKTPLSSFLVLLGFLMGGFFIGQMLLTAIGIFYTNFEMEMLLTITTHLTNYPDFKNYMLLMQAAYSLSLFVLAPYLFIKLYYKQSPFKLLESNKERPVFMFSLLLTVLIGLVAMPIISRLVSWNEAIKLPSFLSDWEIVMQQQEKSLQELTLFMTTFASFGAFILGMFAIAILPAIGEELLFRGVLQKQIQQLSGSIHVGIWVSAILFGILHLQFYGIAPRAFLGILFGYLYVWSGSLWLPILAHFINNATTLLLAYLQQLEVISIDDSQTANWWLTLISLLLISILLFYFKKINTTNKKLVSARIIREQN